MAIKNTEPLTEPAARALLAAGKPLPLAWLWLLGPARIDVINPLERGKTLKVRTDGQGKRNPESGG